MKLALDAMGGDNAPEEIVKGAIDAVKKYAGVDFSEVHTLEEARALVENAEELAAAEA